ncbi:helix-turn-helix domain-containing protein [Amycolatopsis regifaucium]|uniref:Transcriptional regulator n=1 Tax=Amycolatopsis regifaucium TaxID=546365 RepID=A0A154MV62_9PSEU|nr:helix-turn-helix transcriptional regulator [Amycolatopsis regifaucium]KZB88171.1 XRE family transcriptional regulator [Amycolatopsis regifaucium]OKA04328.1 transcriptional regulator [Amycolatopsis regifaucium]
MIVTTTLTANRAGRPVGELLREWRDRRRISQLDLAISAEISTRHLSFVETGRSKPSRDMVLRLGEHLEVPLRERNQLLLAAGYAPAYPEGGLGDPELAAVRQAVRQLLTSHEPYPAAVVDRGWNLVDANASVSIMTDLVSPTLMTPPVNVLRLTLHPEGMAPYVRNLGEWRAHLLGRLRRQVTQTADPALTELLEELLTYPCEDPVPEVEVPGPGDIFVPLRLRHEGVDLTFFSTVSTFGTPLDITVAELVIESFFPADPGTAEYLRAHPRRGVE